MPKKDEAGPASIKRSIRMQDTNARIGGLSNDVDEDFQLAMALSLLDMDARLREAHSARRR